MKIELYKLFLRKGYKKMTKEKLIEMLKDEATQEKLVKCNSTEEVQAVLKEAGVDASIDELNQIRGELSGELSDDAVAEVAGGGGYEAGQKVKSFFLDDLKLKEVGAFFKGLF